MKAPYGSWKSPITSDLIVAESIGLSAPQWHGEDLFWVESRPQEAGRNVLVRRTRDGSEQDINQSPFNIRTRVHEYGGGSLLLHNGSAYFCNYEDQQIYRQELGNRAPTQLTHEDGLRFADGCVDIARNRIIYVVEDHRGQGEPENTIGSVDLDDGTVTTLAHGHDFYAAPAVNPDGSLLAFMTWNHPDMPWDETEIWLCEIDSDGSLGEPANVAGGQSGDQKISVQQPKFSPDGDLYFISDESGWWNLYRHGQGASICQMDAEFGGAHWQFGLSTFGFLDEETITCIYSKGNVSQLAKLSIGSGDLTDIALEYTSLTGLSTQGETLVTHAASPLTSPELARVDLSSGNSEVFKRSSQLDIEPGYISLPETVEFPTGVDETSHGFHYPPTNPEYQGPSGEAPPLVVMLHGGPTAATKGILALGIQFWTSRGFAVLDLNYRGSTGYGRAYRDRLVHNWGVTDVEDSVSGAEYLVSLGKADAGRLAIRGGSAGGYTTLSALTFADTFSAGASYFGVSDLEALAKETHKFEARYLDSMIGAYPEEIELYKARSPIHHVERLSSPCIFFQGLEDQVVPPNQAETMVDALTRKGIPVAYAPFEGEQHGFRIAANIKRSLDLELYFYSRIFNFTPADVIDPIPIINLD
jgi:dipeptidyl aminopeptidase/acylaminoacyl peptidase